MARLAVAYRAFRAGLIGERMLSSLTADFKQDWNESKAKQKAKDKLRDGGPNYYVVRRHRLGPALLGLVENSLRGGVLTYSKAALVLGVKPRNVDPLLRVDHDGS